MDDLLNLAGAGKRKASETEPVKRVNPKSQTIEHMMADVEAIQQDMPTVIEVPETTNYTKDGTIITDERKKCTHKIAFPSTEKPPAADDPVFTLPRVEKMAKKYPFDLDPFQVKAVAAVDRNESVLVAAHTSAGKTVVAEYAIAQALARNQRIIYTSPIKALSNQKYNDLCKELKSTGDDLTTVGLMTGDATINKNAPILVMTTEILRAMLYKGDEVRREVGWVVFDECHYMRDSERGVVWEETIAMLPHQVRYVFLSATIPNAKQFAGWIAHTHHQRCHVIYTEYRPTPLEVFIHTKQMDGTAAMWPIVDDRGRFNDAKFDQGMSSMQHDRQSKADNTAELKKLIEGLHNPTGTQDRGTPAIVFAFSKARVNELGAAIDTDLLEPLRKKTDGMDGVEAKAMVRTVYTAAIETLSPEDRRLDAVTGLLPLLLRGVGTHHSGMLPTMKELVEILFGEGLLKLLVATETFAMGLNMPARTVIFSGVTKWDGEKQRILTAGEFTQMAGRAGRRGVDAKGRVIVMTTERVEKAEARHMIRGGSDDLNSSFRVSYNMLLNTMRIEGDDPRAMLQASFMQYQRRAALPGLLAEAKEARVEHDAITVDRQQDVEAHHRKLQAMIRQTERMAAELGRVPGIDRPGKLLRQGRLVFVAQPAFGWGVVVNTAEREGRVVTLDVLVRAVEGPAGWLPAPAPAQDGLGAGVTVETVRVSLTGIACVGARLIPDKMMEATIGVAPNALEQPENRTAVYTKMASLMAPRQRRAPKKAASGSTPTPPDPAPVPGDPLSAHLIIDLDHHKPDPRRAPKVSESEKRARDTLDRTRARLATAVASARASPDMDSPSMLAGLEAWGRKSACLDKINECRDAISGALDIVMADDVDHMSGVLDGLSFIQQQGDQAAIEGGSVLVDTKGRFACEINTANEVLLTELVFGGVFRGLTPQDTAGILAALIDETPAEVDPTFASPPLTRAVERTRAVATTVGGVMERCGVDTSGPEFAESNVRLGLVPHMYLWAQGKTLRESLEGADDNVFEGNFIRVLRRLDVLLAQVVAGCEAAGMDGDDGEDGGQGADVFRRAQACVHRGIIFQESLWTHSDDSEGR